MILKYLSQIRRLVEGEDKLTNEQLVEDISKVMGCAKSSGVAQPITYFGKLDLLVYPDGSFSITVPQSLLKKYKLLDNNFNMEEFT